VASNEKVKGQPHLVPLAIQAVEVLRKGNLLIGHGSGPNFWEVVDGPGPALSPVGAVQISTTLNRTEDPLLASRLLEPISGAELIFKRVYAPPA